MGPSKKEKKSEPVRPIYESQFECKRDDLVIRGTEYRPEGKHLPIAIVCPDFKADQKSILPYVKALAEMGYAAYCFSFCGGRGKKGRSDGELTEISIQTEVHDLKIVLQFVTHLPYVNPARILLMGCGQGGLVAALAAGKYKSRIFRLALCYPTFHLPDEIRAGKFLKATFDPANIPDTIRCGFTKLGRCFASDILDMNAYEIAKAYPGKVLLIQGTKDKVVPADVVQRIQDVYQSTRPEDMAPEKRVRVHTIKGGKHGFSKKQTAAAIEELKTFAKFHTKTRE